MSKKVIVAGQTYDSRTIVENVERLKFPNHPKINALAIPVKLGKDLTGKMIVVVKIPFGNIVGNTKEIRFELSSPRRIDAINKAVELVKASPMYRRITTNGNRDGISSDPHKNRL